MTDLTKDTERQFPFDDTIFKTRKHYARTGTVPITAVADGGGGEITVSAAGHEYTPGDIITQAGTTSYNGDFVVQSVSGDTYNVIDTFVATETGTTQFDVDIVGKLLFEGKAHPKIAESTEEWQIHKNLYDAAGILVGSDFAQSGGKETNGFRFAWSKRFILTYGT